MHVFMMILSWQDATIAKQQQEITQLTSELADVRRMNESEKEAVSNLRQCVQELRSSLSSKEGELAQVTNQLDESKRVYNELSKAYDEKVGEIKSSL